MSTPKNALSSSGQLKAVSRQHELAMQSEVIMRHPEGESDLSTACCSRTAAASRDLPALVLTRFPVGDACWALVYSSPICAQT